MTQNLSSSQKHLAMAKISLLDNIYKFILILCKMVETYFKSSVIYWGDLYLPCIHFIAELFKSHYLQCTIKNKKLRSYLSIKLYMLIDKFRAAISCSHPERTSLQGK